MSSHTKQTQNMDSSCLICKEPSKEVKVPLNSSNSFTLSELNFILQGHLPVIEESDKLSQWFCPKCLQKIVISSKFIRQLIQVQSNFFPSTIKIKEEPLEEEERDLQNEQQIDIEAQLDEDMLKTLPLDILSIELAEPAPSNEEHICVICNRSYKDKASLSKHVKCCHENPFVCDLCNKKFASKTFLTTHLLQHFDHKPYKCKICSKSFRQIHNLRSHTFTHTGERPYTCTICNRGFRRRDILVAHSLIHSGERPYSCSICDKTYTQRSSLHCHMKKHAENGETVPKDQVNGSYKFRGKVKQRSEMSTKHFGCGICGRSYRLEWALENHMKIVHGGALSMKEVDPPPEGINNSSMELMSIIKVEPEDEVPNN